MLPKPLELAHQMISTALTAGCLAVDATLGNGYDTKFLIESFNQLGGGKLYGVDLQIEAVQSTQTRLETTSTSAVELILENKCHAEIDYETIGAPKVVVFNLGYLPKFDKSIITKPSTSLKAVQNACKYLLPEGIISIMGYLGHDGGAEECSVIENFLSELPREQFRVLKYQYLNAPNSPPYLLLVEKIQDQKKV